MPDKLKKTRGMCPHCGGARSSIVRGEFERNESNEDGWWHQQFRILECGGCGTVYFEETSTSSESNLIYDAELAQNVPEGQHYYWPQIEMFKRPAWMNLINIKDRALRRTLHQTYNAANREDRILAGAGLRTAFDRASELFKVPSHLTFAQKLDDLLAKGRIGNHEKDHLNVLIEAGNATTHRAWEPTGDQLKELLSVLEAFLYRAFVTQVVIKEIKTAIPKKKKKKRL